MAITSDKDKISSRDWVRENIIEYILLSCLKGATFDDLVQMMPLSPPELLKKYLFYLIDYDLISYNGQKHLYLIKYAGFKLLSRL